MSRGFIKKWFQRWSTFDSAISLIGYAWTAIASVMGLTVAGIVAWATTTLGWYWSTLGLAGAAAAFLITLLVLAFFMNAIARFLRAWRGQPEGQVQSQCFLSNAIIVGGEKAKVEGEKDRPPEFRALPAENGRNVTFHIEYSFSFGGIGRSNQWTRPSSVLAHELSRFSRGEEINFPQVSQCEVHDKLRWRFGPPRHDDLPNQPRDLLNLGTCFKGRVIGRTEDGREQHCYFIARTYADELSDPDVLGEHMFDHILSWEELPLRNGEAAALFR